MDCAMDTMQGELFRYCAQCGTEHAAAETFRHEVYERENTRTYYLCTELCRQYFAQTQMRRLEGDYVPEL